MSEALALIGLAACLAVAIVRPRRAPDWAVASGCAALLVLGGVLSPGQAGVVLRQLGPTIGFLAALLLLAEGCVQEGVFEALGAAMASGSQGRARRLFGLVFAVASTTTAVLSLDATVLLLTPVVFATAARLRLSARPHVYACSHLANSASLLLPVSNLTNLLAFRALHLSFLRFAALMVAPWAAAVAFERLVLGRAFAAELAGTVPAPPPRPVPRPRFAGAVLALTLAGFLLSSAISLAPVWVAAAGAVALAARRRPRPAELMRAAQPGFLIFVLGLGVVVAAATRHGLGAAIEGLLPRSSGLPALLAVAGLSALAANLLNNLPATLLLLPAVAGVGRGPVLAMLIGVGVGPNLTYVGSLATLLWRRVLHAHEHPSDVAEFTRLGALTVPGTLVVSTVALWLALQL